ncbi:GNAT family N-acetyltransferase [Oceanobacillus saliphilus]|uniref:GNAT family N-acetyltransferase n=1 Tax=Oceanobacillus saliphilus TaxID=2925834 RepID=UPI00201E6FCE|nr:GNAT family N-acetyltransferase [Oceanobacillus saliphilus]
MDQIKKLTEADYDEIFALSQFAFQYKLTEEALVKKKEETKRHTIWGWMEDGKIAAKAHLIPLSVYINGKPFEMGGISAVSTWPEYRRNGMVKQLLAHALKHMKENGQVISYLHPFSVPFYRKFGWEMVFEEKKYTIPMDNLKRKWSAEGYVRRSDADIELLHQIYTAYAMNFNGMLTRDEKWWEQRVLAKNSMVAVCYDKNNQAEGYLIYSVKENMLQVEELVYNSLNGWRLLLEFISNHDSMAKEVKMTVPVNDNLPLLVDEPRFKQEISPYFMVRIVDVLAFLKEFPFEQASDTSLFIHVEDSFLPDNSGVYKINQQNGSTEVTHLVEAANEKAEVHCNVQQFAAIMFGYKRPMELYRAGLIQGNQDALEKLNKLIPVSQSFFPDFF